MEPTSQRSSSVNIGSTVAKLRSIAPQLFSAHAMTGCDTVASYFGIGKTKVVKVLEAGNRLNHLGNPSVNLEAVLCESTAFVAACYGQKCETRETMTDVRYKGFPKQDEKVLPKLEAIDSGGIQGKHKEGLLLGMHMESCFRRKPRPIKIWVGQR